MEAHQYKKFVIITRSRTGSNFLKTLLNAHENIYVLGEMFQMLRNNTCLDIWKEIFSERPPKIKWVGFKLFYYHPLDSQSREVWHFLKNDPTIRIIHLKRKNLLRVHVSRLIAGKNNIWSSKKKNETPRSEKKVRVDIDRLFNDMQQTLNWERQLKLEFINHQIFTVEYEDLVAKQKEVITAIFEFLKIPNQRVKSELKKLNPEKLQDLVVNYDELHKALNNGKYAFMLNDYSIDSK